MSDIAIQVENLSKKYLVRHTTSNWHDGLRHTIDKCAKAPFRRLFASESRRSRKNSFEEFYALEKVNLEIKRGDVVGIIGRNGAGKTTLLKILSRITEPTEGRARLRGLVATLLEIGTGFHPELTGRENIFLNGSILGMKRAEIRARFDEIVGFAEVGRFVDTPVKRYSSGMQVRLGFAVAAYLDPEILLVDEVLAVGDYEFQRKCIRKMGQVSNQGRTVLFVSHNMMSISTMCNRSVWLDHGRIVLDGASSTVVQQYLSACGAKNGEISWQVPGDAPGNDRVRLHAVRVALPNGQASGNHMVHESISIVIDYWNLMPGRKINVGIWLKDELGNAVLGSANLPSENLTVDPWFGRPRPVGLYRTVCRIPGDLLHTKSYSLDVMFSSGTTWGLDFHLEDVMSFEISDPGIRNIYQIKWPGVVRPRLAWSTKRLADLPLGIGDPEPTTVQ